MIKELLISIYLLAYRVIYCFFRFFSVKKKTVFRISFADNAVYLARELYRRQTEQIIIIYDRNLDPELFSQISHVQLVANDFRKPIEFMTSIYHIATAQTLFIDNYFGFLSALPHKKRPRIIQLWHANGAIKMFGLYDKSNSERSAKAIRRFNSVYNQFDFTLVGSDKMADIFKHAFNLSEESMVKLGIPRTDFFFNQDEVKHSKKQLENKFPMTQTKKVILYAPTFRENNDTWDMHIDFDLLADTMGSDYLFFVKLHPSIEDKHISLPDSVINISQININEFLLLTDILITDYSSIPFEYALLSKPMIFHAPDLAEYKDERGLWEDYHQLVPGPVTANTLEIIEALETVDHYQKKLIRFNQEWNKYSKGDSSKKVIEFFYD